MSKLSRQFAILVMLYRNYRTRSNDAEDGLASFGATRAARDAQLGRLGRVNFVNTLANHNYALQDSVFQCRHSGLYFFALAARGRWSYDNNGYVQDSESARRIQLYNLRSRESDREVCFDWK